MIESPPCERNEMGRTARSAVLALLMIGLAGSAAAAEIAGAGAVFPAPVYEKWARAYKAKTRKTVEYSPVGTDAGIERVQAKAVTFGASDRPLPGKDLYEAGQAQFPTVIGAIAPIVNLRRIKPGTLYLDGPTLAKIYLGRITSWSDPAIKALNPDLELPDLAITVFHRKDSAGTTFGFTSYLSKVNPDWDSQVGSGAWLPEWPAGAGVKGEDAMASGVESTRGAIGYVELNQALRQRLTYTGMVNRAGAKVLPDLKSIQAAAASADWLGVPGFGVILADQPGLESWPIARATFILVDKNPSDPAAMDEALSFFRWAYHNGDEIAKEFDLLPLPDPVVALIEESWSQVKTK